MSAAAAFLSTLSADCTNFANMTPKQKARIGIMCGMLGQYWGFELDFELKFSEIGAGVAVGICVSLYAAHIKYEYDHPYKNQR